MIFPMQNRLRGSGHGIAAARMDAKLNAAGWIAEQMGGVRYDSILCWRHRNSCVFNGVAPSVPAVLEMAKEEALLWTMAGAKGLSMLLAIGTTVS
jgi:Zn-dependent M16 (insulinase) family peptidase